MLNSYETNFDAQYMYYLYVIQMFHTEFYCDILLFKIHKAIYDWLINWLIYYFIVYCHIVFGYFETIILGCN
jgi:hypothetical protein